MVSVIIPAHNESNVIADCLKAIVQTPLPEQVEILVVCNGCQDDTATKVRSCGPAVRVIETPVASKSNALNVGDQHARGFPRFYMDADITLGPGALEQVIQTLKTDGILAASPEIRVDLHGRPWAVRAFYSVWLQLPYLCEGMIGSGLYAVSEAGRARFGRFPAITADDAYVRLHFAPDERRTVQGCYFTIKAPRSIGRLIAIKTRGHFGNIELRARHPELWRNENARHGQALLRLAYNPAWWPAIAVYVMVRMISRWKAGRRWASGDHARWERDDTSRASQAS